MTAIVLTKENIHTVKRSLRAFFPEAKSSHLSEALATAVGRRTHAALLTDLANMDPADPEITLVDEGAFVSRANEIGFEVSQEVIEYGIDPFFANEGMGLIETDPISSWSIGYTSLRDRAWRNMMVAGINAGIEKKLFSLLPGDNRWPTTEASRTYVFDLTFGDGVPALCSLSDAGWDEISVHVALWPTDRGVEFVAAAFAGFHAGDAYASGWLERRNGAWLQSDTSSLRCRRRYLRTVAETKVSPKGFGDRGKLIM